MDKLLAIKQSLSKSSVEIIAVSKTREEKEILPILKGGHRIFGENRVQEAVRKWIPLKERYPDVSLHLIGALQTNKVKEILEVFDVIETVDRPKLAKVIADTFFKTGKSLDCFIQVNTGEEPQKAGVIPQEADVFIRECVDELDLPIKGLMCIPPKNDNPSLHFALLSTIAKRNGIQCLSMGMSGDYKIAAAMGATHLRIGSAIFG